MKRSGFKKPSYEEWLAKAKTVAPRKKLRIVGKSTSTEIKTEIQAILRQIVMIRDGGCFLRNYASQITPQYRECGGYRNDGELILQAEHLNSRSHAISFSDPRLVVCVCKRHHIYYKPQHSAEYNELAREFIGEENAKLWDRVREDKTSHKVDLNLELLVLKQVLKTYQQGKK